MRRALVLLTLFVFGCAELRYPTRTAMQEVPPDRVERAAADPPPSPVRSRRWQPFIIGGTVVSVIGAGLLIGGAVGWKKQEADNAAADADCTARGGWFCGLLDGLSYMPYGVMLGFGAAATISGLVLFAIGSNRADRERNHRP